MKTIPKAAWPRPLATGKGGQVHKVHKVKTQLLVICLLRKNNMTVESQLTSAASTAGGLLNLRTFPWPSGEKALELLQKSSPQALIHGLPGSARAFFLAWAYERFQESMPWVLVTPSAEEAVLLQNDLSNWLPHVPVLLCPSWEVLPQDVETPDPELIGDRQRAFYHVLQEEKGIVISPLIGALQHTLPPGEWLDQVLILKKGQDAPPDL